MKSNRPFNPIREGLEDYYDWLNCSVYDYMNDFPWAYNDDYEGF